MVKKAPIFVAIDTSEIDVALKIANDVKDFVTGVKIGPIFFSKNSIDEVSKFSKMGLQVFVDNKIHDIGSTIEKSLIGVSSHPIDYYTIHISNGLKTLKLAKETIQKTTKSINLLGVTVLTSLDDSSLSEIGIKNKINDEIQLLASLAKKAKLDGIICDGKNIKNVKKVFDGKIFVPGVRLNKKFNDQNPLRSLTPKQALEDGASFLVCGREVTEGNVSENIKKIISSLNQ